MSETFVTVIIGHINRAAQCADLQYRVGGHIFLDDGRLGEWDNHERALAWAATQNVTHVIVLQDDAQPVQMFNRDVARAVSQRPNELISLYLGTGHMHPEWSKRIENAVRNIPVNTSWLEADALLHGVGFVIPRGDIEPMLRWARGEYTPTDYRIGDWYSRQNLKTYYTWPSLVDHEDKESVTIHLDGLKRDKPRKAFATGKFIGYRKLSHKI